MLFEGSKAAKEDKCTHEKQALVIIDDNGLAEKKSGSKKGKGMIYPLAKEVHKFIYFERPFMVSAYHGSANFYGRLHGAGKTSAVKQSYAALHKQQIELGIEVKNLLMKVNERDHPLFKDEKDEYLHVNLNPNSDDMKYIYCLQKCTNAYLNANLALMEGRSGSSDNDRGTVDPLTIGITRLVGYRNRANKEYNSNIRTKPYLDKAGIFSAQSASNILKQHVCLQLLCFKQGRNDFNLSKVTPNDFDLKKKREKWWKVFGTSSNPGPKTGNFEQSPDTSHKLNEVFIQAYKAARKSIREEALKSLCPSLLKQTIDQEFKELLHDYIMSDFSDIPKNTSIESITYEDAIEMISTAIGEAIAVRWSNDCGFHWDKLTCFLFHRTYFCSFKQKLSDLPKGTDIYKKLQLSSAIDKNSNEQYQSCMVATYGRIFVHDYCKHVATREMALESPYFCNTAKILVKLLKITQGTILDYGFLFQCEPHLSEYYTQYKCHDKRFNMSGTMYKVPMTYSRIVSTISN